MIHNYRWPRSLAQRESQYDELDRKPFQTPVVALPAITIASNFHGPAADGMAYATLFSGNYSHQILKDIGHNVPQEAPRIG